MTKNKISETQAKETTGSPAGRAPARRSPMTGTPPRLPWWKRGKEVPAPQGPATTTHLHWILFGLVVVIALFLRLREPLSSPIMGAEDPYLHMERTWNFVQGKEVTDYPIGFMMLLAPFTLFGPDGFYAVARYLPSFLGAASVAGVFLLARRYVEPTGAIAAALFVAVMPEHIKRTNLLFPTALDLALLPFFFMAFLRAVEGNRRSLYTVAGLGLVYLFVHPWFLAIAGLPLAAFWLVRTLAEPKMRSWTAAGSGATFVVFVGVLFMLPDSKPVAAIMNNALPRLAEILTAPSSLFPLPDHVDFRYMITWPIAILALAGGVLGLMHRTPLSLLAFLWSVLLLPLCIVDWLGMSFVPHRVMVYLGMGLAILAAIPVAELLKVVNSSTQKSAKTPVMLGTMAVLGVLLVPSALATPTWYRQYEAHDFEAWEALDARGTTFVVAGSWEARSGYRALTGRDAMYDPAFFTDERRRGLVLDENPDLIVVVDRFTEKAGRPTGFLATWTPIGTWQDVEAYAPPPR